MLGVLWQSTQVFIVAYTPQLAEDTDPPLIMVVNVPVRDTSPIIAQSIKEQDYVCDCLVVADIEFGRLERVHASNNIWCA